MKTREASKISWLATNESLINSEENQQENKDDDYAIELILSTSKIEEKVNSSELNINPKEDDRSPPGATSASDMLYTISLSDRDAPEASDKCNHEIPFMPLVKIELKEGNAFVEEVQQSAPIEVEKHEKKNRKEHCTENVLPASETKASPADHITMEEKSISAESITSSLTEDFVKIERVSSVEKISSVMTWTVTNQSDHADERQILTSLSDNAIALKKATSGKQRYVIKSIKDQQLTADDREFEMILSSSKEEEMKPGEIKIALTEDFETDTFQSNGKIPSAMTWTKSYHSDLADELQILSSLSDRPKSSTKLMDVKKNSSSPLKNNQQHTVDDRGIEMVLSTSEIDDDMKPGQIKITLLKTAAVEERNDKTIRGMLRKGAVTVGGGALIAVGIPLIPTPAPGALFIAGGLSLLGTEYPEAQEILERGRDKLEEYAEVDDIQEEKCTTTDQTDEVQDLGSSNTTINGTEQDDISAPNEKEVEEISNNDFQLVKTNSGRIMRMVQVNNGVTGIVGSKMQVGQTARLVGKEANQKLKTVVKKAILPLVHVIVRKVEKGQEEDHLIEVGSKNKDHKEDSPSQD